MELMNEYLKRNLKPRRYTHSLGVVETATRLAEIYGADREKAHLAAAGPFQIGRGAPAG